MAFAKSPLGSSTSFLTSPNTVLTDSFALWIDNKIMKELFTVEQRIYLSSLLKRELIFEVFS